MEKRISIKKRPRSYANPTELDELKRNCDLPVHASNEECINSLNSPLARHSYSAVHLAQQQGQQQQQAEEFMTQSTGSSDSLLGYRPSLNDFSDEISEPQQFPQLPSHITVWDFSHCAPPSDYSIETVPSFFGDDRSCTGGNLIDSYESSNFVQQHDISTAVNNFATDSDTRMAFSCDDISEEQQLACNHDVAFTQSEKLDEQRYIEVAGEKRNGWFKAFMGKFKRQN